MPDGNRDQDLYSSEALYEGKETDSGQRDQEPEFKNGNDQKGLPIKRAQPIHG